MIDDHTLIQIVVISLLCSPLLLWWAFKQGLKRAQLNTLPKKLRVLQCGNCEHFDLQARDKALAHQPAFKLAMQWRTPEQMYGEGAKGTQWAEYGVCSEHTELRHCKDKCEAFQMKVSPGEV